MKSLKHIAIGIANLIRDAVEAGNNSDTDKRYSLMSAAYELHEGFCTAVGVLVPGVRSGKFDGAFDDLCTIDMHGYANNSDIIHILDQFTKASIKLLGELE